MDLWTWLRDFLEIDTTPENRPFSNQDLIANIEELAERENCSPEEIATRLLSEALQARSARDEILLCWQTLSFREQEITALTCLNLTNRQIAARLNISPETVKTHLRNILYKFGITTKQELRRLLSEWDFSNWLTSP